MVSCMFDIIKSIPMCRIIPCGLWWRPSDPTRHRYFMFPSQVAMECYWVPQIFCKVVSLIFVYCDPQYIYSWLWSLMSTWIHSVSYCVHDHVYHTWSHSVLFGSHDSFLLLIMGMPTSGLIYMITNCLEVLPGSFSHRSIFVKCLNHHLIFWPHTLGGIYYTTIFHPIIRWVSSWIHGVETLCCYAFSVRFPTVLCLFTISLYVSYGK